MAVNMGGDDFIAKPFDLSVLTAKVQAMLRRTYEFAGTANLLEHRGAILLGVLLYRLLFQVLMKLTGLKGTIRFAFSTKAAGMTAALFGIIFLINFLLSLRQIHVSQPVELLHGEAEGEREPKTKFLTARAYYKIVE